LNLVLIGFRGSGKTTVGRLLAEAAECAFIDTDALVVHLAGRDIATIFAEEGEAGFRRREAEAIRIATAKPDRVISVGGGAVEDESNRNQLRAYGTVVWLEAPPEILWQRIQSDPSTRTSRPNLGCGGLEEVRTLLSHRARQYAQAAHFVVRVSDRTPKQVMSDIQEWLSAQD